MAENEKVNQNEESECTHDCSTCSAKCGSREPQSLIEPQNKASDIKHVIGVVSGKGGVGKSSVTALLATLTRRLDYKTAILDADITGPSIPKIFGLKGDVTGCEDGILPLTTHTGIHAISVNMLLRDETAPVVWRGPVIAGTVKQFWTDVVWGDVDYMYVDMPPGTGDVPLTVMQSIPLDGIIIVATPQDLVSMIVAKAVNMARMMNIPILGIIENYSYMLCPDCGKKIEVFGKSHVDEIAMQYSIPVLARLPIDPKLAALCDAGTIETVETDLLDAAVEIITSK
ncbi:MAG: Mrp/NBP35 family ATP-binding protein [Clostridia bacterium]|nr:Mrp/NBP35 family ATP-binding protein [Clostridia bacterium]